MLKWFNYRTQEGDTLNLVSSAYNVPVNFLKKANPGAARFDPDKELPQDMLLLVYPYHEVEPGDCLWDIAQQYNLTVADLVRLNSIPNPDLIYPGQRIRLPLDSAQLPDQSVQQEQAVGGGGDQWTGTPSNLPNDSVSYPDWSNDPPPLYDDDVIAAQRIPQSKYYLRIGDCQFAIPPESIQVKYVSEYVDQTALRSSSTINYKSGHSDRELLITIYFYGPEGINGTSYPGPGGKTYYLDGLRHLVAQFKRTPIVPIVNELINDEYGIYNVALERMVVSTIRDVPKLVKVDLQLAETSVEPYILRSDVEYHNMIFWPLMRWYCQQPLDHKRPNGGLRLAPVPDTGMTSDFKLKLVDETFFTIDSVKRADLDPDAYMQDVELQQTAITSMTLEIVNRFAKLHVLEQEAPSHQFLGCMDTRIVLTMETQSRDDVSVLAAVYDTTERYSRMYRDRTIAGYIGVENHLINACGVRHAMIDSFTSTTLEQGAGTFQIALTMYSFDITDARIPLFNAITPVLGADQNQLESVVKTSVLGDNILAHTVLAERLLNTLELYPDLELPTFDEVEKAVVAINKQRVEAGLKPYNFKVHRPGGLQCVNAMFVDPDFYVAYPGRKHGGLIDQAALNKFQGIKVDTSPMTQVASKPITATTWEHLDLRFKSGLTAKEIDDYIAEATAWRGNQTVLMRNTGAAFLEAERVTGINAAFLVAVAALESGWGTSDICKDKYNFYGLAAYNSDPYDSAMTFSSVWDGIVSGAKVIKRSFIDTGRTTIYSMIWGDTANSYAYYDDGRPNDSWVRKVASIASELLPLDRIAGRTFIDVNSLTTQAQNLPSWFGAEFKELIAPLESDDVKIPLSGDSLASGMCYDMMRYEKKGRMVQAFPTYCLLFLDESGWQHGRRLWTNYYPYHSVLDMTIVREIGNPVDVAYITLIDIYGTLNRQDGFRYIPESLLEAIFGQINKRAIEAKQALKRTIAIKAGSRVHIRLGYGSTACDMPVVFNGTITDVQLGDTVRIVCQGDGAELVNPITSFNKNSVNKGLLMGFSAYSIINSLIANPGPMAHLFGGYFANDPPNGVVHFGVAQRADLFNTRINLIMRDYTYDIMKNVYDGIYFPSDDRSIFEYQEIDENRIVETARELADKIAAFIPDPQSIDPIALHNTLVSVVMQDNRLSVLLGEPGAAELGKYIMDNDLLQTRDVLVSGIASFMESKIREYIHMHSPGENKKNVPGFQIWLYEKSPWDIINIMAKAIPGFVASVEPHQFRSTLFFGSPYYNIRYAYTVKDGKYYEYFKPLAQYHFLDSAFDILGNTVSAQSADLATCCVARYTIGSNSVEQTDPIKADYTIRPECQKTDVIDTSLLQDSKLLLNIEILGLSMEKVGSWVWDRARQQAMEMAKSHLVSKFREMYEGEIIVIGNPTIKPHDLLYIADRYTLVSGTCCVRRVVHNLGPTYGFTTQVTPGLLTFQDSSPVVKDIVNIMSIGTSLSMVLLREFLVAKASSMLGPISMANLVGTTISTASKVAGNTISLAGKAMMSKRIGRFSLDMIGSVIDTIGELVGSGGQITANITEYAMNMSAYAFQRMFPGAYAKILEKLTVPIGVLNPIGIGIMFVVTSYVNFQLKRLAEILFANKNVLTCYPLWYKDKPLLAGVNGYRYLVPGYPDPNYYDSESPYTVQEIQEKYKETGGWPAETTTTGGWPTETISVTFPIDLLASYCEITRIYGPDHKGVDIASTDDQAWVRAFATGTVLRCMEDVNKEGSFTVVIDHTMGYKTVYVDLSEVTVRTGDRVVEGDIIGKIGYHNGDTPSFHFEIRFNNEPIDPTLIISYAREKDRASKVKVDNAED